MKTALITGIGGQDGGFLADLLLAKGYRVVGTSRDASRRDYPLLDSLGITHRVEVLSMLPTDRSSVFAAIEHCQPDEIYALAGQSSVGRSFEQPVETLASSIFGTLHILEAMRLTCGNARLYHASSSECFGDLGGQPAFETTPFRPRSPYGVAKASSHMLTANYRDAYGIFACNGILFNHESPSRPLGFVTSKIADGVRRIAGGNSTPLQLGRLDIARDWGWAPEFVEAMWAMLQTERPDDYIIATGKTHTLAEFVAEAFASVGLDWREFVRSDPAFNRPADLAWSGGSPVKAERDLGWRATVTMAEVARRMVAGA
jgi:GDPmannose 4,6-dehydratase